MAYAATGPGGAGEETTGRPAADGGAADPEIDRGRRLAPSKQALAGIHAALADFLLTNACQSRPSRRRVLFRFPVPESLTTGVWFMRHAVIVLVAVSCFSIFARTQTAEELVEQEHPGQGRYRQDQGHQHHTQNRQVRGRRRLHRGGGSSPVRGPTWSGKRSRCRA